MSFSRLCLCLPAVDRSVCDLQAEMERHLKDERKGERLRSGVQVVIAGSTNAGKSSLLNTLCKEKNQHTHARFDGINIESMTYSPVNTLPLSHTAVSHSLEEEEGNICHTISGIDP